MPNQLAIAYAPNLSGGQPANTSATGSFLIGNMNTRAWNMVIPQTTTNTQYFASPITSSAFVCLQIVLHLNIRKAISFITRILE